MKQPAPDRERLIALLDGTVSQAVLFFRDMDGSFFDGHQNAREVLSHLVFWHQQYCSITEDLLKERKLKLLKGSQAHLNKRAFHEFRSTSMPELADCFSYYQEILAGNLCSLADWEVNFPFKMGCRKTDVAGRIIAIEKHVRHHLTRQQRASQRGEDWINAYYPQESSATRL